MVFLLASIAFWHSMEFLVNWHLALGDLSGGSEGVIWTWSAYKCSCSCTVHLLRCIIGAGAEHMGFDIAGMVARGETRLLEQLTKFWTGR